MSWLLDTNIISEFRKKKPDPDVEFWLACESDENLFISVVTIGQIRFGVEKLRLRDPIQAEGLERWLVQTQVRFRGRIKPVTEEIADIWGGLSPAQPLPLDDGLIAATALYHGLTVVTRNVNDFKRSGVDIYNPFND